MNKLSKEERVRVIAALVEGNAINATVRMTGISKPTILKLLADVGHACAVYQDRTLRNLVCKRVQCDEIWSFCYAKSKNVPKDKRGTFGYGDVWTWTAIDADTKLVPSWLVADRSAESAHLFMQDLAERLATRVQLTTDGHKAYLEAVEHAFGSNIDYAMLMKIYGTDQEKQQEVRYSPAVCLAVQSLAVMGNPDTRHVSTSFAERQNLTMRMSMRRFTRLTNAHSKKVENLEHAVALHFMYYNFCRVHESLRCTPAMAAGVEKRIWKIEDIVNLLG